MQNAHVRLNPGLPWKKQHQQEEDLFHRQIERKFREEISARFGA